MKCNILRNKIDAATFIQLSVLLHHPLRKKLLNKDCCETTLFHRNDFGCILYDETTD